MLDPDLMPFDEDGPTTVFATIAVLALVFAVGFAVGYIVAGL